MADQSTNPNRENRLYNPYQEIQDLHLPVRNLYNLPTSPEYLFNEESLSQRRSWSENLQYYTGSSYLAGTIIGGANGTIQGIRAAEPGDTLKLRINRVLNSGGQTGRRFGNSMGVLGLIFAGLESCMINWRDTDDLLNSVVAGLGTGALYRAASGPRSAAIAGAIGGLAAGAAVAGKQVMKRYVPI